MLCQQCKKNPVAVNYVENINGNKLELHLCAECYLDLCAEAEGKSDSKAVNGLYSGFFSSAKTEQKTCPVCGTTYEDYERTGLLGCADCYEVFKDELIPAILRIQGKIEHVGKVDAKYDARGLNSRLKELQVELEEALKNRRFGEADRLNRQINAIKKTLYGGAKNG